MFNLTSRIVAVAHYDSPGDGCEVGLLGRLDQRVRLARAPAAEVIVVDRPEHDAAQTVVAHVFRLRALIWCQQ